MINVHGLRNPAGPLLAFGEALGIASDVWVEREELEQITYTDSEFSREKAMYLTLDQISLLLDAYGDALTCRFRLGDLVVLDIASGLDEASLVEFRTSIRDNPTVVFVFRVGKKRLVVSWGGGLPGYSLFL